jgi:hypothetical protein
VFEKALITRLGDEGVDFGVLAETILFYGSTQLLLNRNSVVSLAKTLQSDDLIAFLDRGEIRLSYLHSQYAVASNGPLGAFNFVAITVRAPRPDGKPLPKKLTNLDFREEIDEVLGRTLGRSTSTSKLAKAIGDRLKLHSFKGATNGTNVVVDLARRDIADPGFLKAAARDVLEHLLPPGAVPPEFTFELIEFGNSYLINTDLDFKRLNAAYHQRVPPSHSSLSCDYLVAHIIWSRADSYFAADYMAEIVTKPVHSRIMRLKHYDLLRARDKSVARLDQFKELACPRFPSIAEVINSGERTIPEFLRLLDGAQRFRHWLHEQSPDEEIIANYVKAAIENTWADRLPAKTTRWAIATVLGAASEAVLPTGIGATTGFAVGALDALYLDRFIKGWRPNHFIEGPFREFTERQSRRPP